MDKLSDKELAESIKYYTGRYPKGYKPEKTISPTQQRSKKISTLKDMADRGEILAPPDSLTLQRTGYLKEDKHLRPSQALTDTTAAFKLRDYGTARTPQEQRTALGLDKPETLTERERATKRLMSGDPEYLKSVEATIDSIGVGIKPRAGKPPAPSKKTELPTYEKALDEYTKTKEKLLTTLYTIDESKTGKKKEGLGWWLDPHIGPKEGLIEDFENVDELIAKLSYAEQAKRKIYINKLKHYEAILKQYEIAKTLRYRNIDVYLDGKEQIHNMLQEYNKKFEEEDLEAADEWLEEQGYNWDDLQQAVKEHEGIE